jgi:hypothetical protein
MNRDIGMIIIRCLRLPARLQAIGIPAMNHLHMMAVPGQFIGQAVHENPIPAEVIGGIKRRDHAKTQRSIHHVIHGFVEDVQDQGCND